MTFDRFCVDLGSILELLGHHLGVFMDVIFWTPFRTPFSSIVGRFWAHFGSHFGYIFRDRGFLDFFNPSCTKTTLLRSGGDPFWRFFRYFFRTPSGRPSGIDFFRILAPFGCPFWGPLGITRIYAHKRSNYLTTAANCLTTANYLTTAP